MTKEFQILESLILQKFNERRRIMREVGKLNG